MSNQMYPDNDSTAKSNLENKGCIWSKPDSKFNNLITSKEVEAIVKKSISTDVKVIDYHFRPYSDEKIGFLGSHFGLVIITQIPKSNNMITTNYFVKSMPFDVPSQLTFMQEKGYFVKEVEFFQSLEPLLMENFKGDSWTPKCYLAKESVLVFEDLNTKGFSNRSKLLDERSVKAALSSIARMHAASLLAEEQNNGKFLNVIFPEIFKESEFIRSNQRGYTTVTVAMDLAVAIANNLGLDSTNVRRAGERIFDISKSSRTMRNVVSHGDLWSNNMMFDDNDKCKLIDFQVIRYSPLAQDVMLLLYLCTSRELRRQSERKLIEYYHDVLIKTLKDNRFKGEVPTLDELLQGAEEQRLPALVIAVMNHQTLQMDGKAATVLSDSQNYENYYFKDRRPFVFKHMAENKNYAKKLEENVRELVEMSLIIETLPTVS